MSFRNTNPFFVPGIVYPPGPSGPFAAGTFSISYESINVGDKTVDMPFILVIQDSEFKNKQRVPAAFENIRENVYRVIFKPGESRQSEEEFLTLVNDLKSGDKIKHIYDLYKNALNNKTTPCSPASWR